MSEITMENEFHNIKQHEFTESIPIKTFGFWIYLMSDCILFAVLFATYEVLNASYAGGPTQKNLFHLTHALIETLCLLSSSFTCGLAVLAMQRRAKKQVLVWLTVTFILGISFLMLELKEFHDLIEKNAGPDRSAFLSAFFTLVGTHGLHVTMGLFWIATMFTQILSKGTTIYTGIRLFMLSLFWHFLDIIWIFIFTFVYLSGML